MAKKSNNAAMVGRYAFLLGLILAIVMGIIPAVGSNAVAMSVLVILGLLIGLLNVSAKETMPFLLATAVLVIVAGFGGGVLSAVQPAVVGASLRGILGALITLIVPASIVVALKEIYAFAEKA
ncbi:hypothetical protein KY308_03605 [Candidatus Woesearchaeota archaeon]|nr:hypothetical protein [Candidatus Woesearchaeota archaeon]